MHLATQEHSNTEDFVVTTTLVIIGLLAAIALATFIVILLLGNLGAFFTRIEQGTTVFINTGKSLRSIWPNIGGFHLSKMDDLDGRHWLIREGKETNREEAFFHNALNGTAWFQKWLWKRFGIRFISIFWPHVHVHSFNIRSRKRLLERADMKEGEPLKKRVTDSPNKNLDVSSLLFLVPRPVYLEGIELPGDNSRINLLFLPIYRQVIPALPVYYLQGDFFTQLDAAIEAAVVDFFASHRIAVYKDDGKKGQFAGDFWPRPNDKKEKGRFTKKYGDILKDCEPSYLTYSSWLKLTKAGEGSPLEQHLRHLNFSAAYYKRLKKERPKLAQYASKELTHGKLVDIPGGKLTRLIPSGIVPRFGFALASFRLVETEPHAETANLAKALLAKETKFHEAEGVRQEAAGNRDAILARAAGEATRYGVLTKALTDQGVSPNAAAEVVLAQVRTENVRDSKLTTYVEGGGPSPTVMVPAQPST